MVVFLNVRTQPFYTPPYPLPGNTFANTSVLSYEDSVLFIVSIWQYLITVIAFSVSKPFRKPIYSNIPFLFSIIMMVIANFVFLFAPNPGTPPCENIDGVLMCPNWPGQNWFINFFMIEPFSYDGASFYKYRMFLLGVIVVNSAVTLLYEKWIMRRLTKGREAKAQEIKAR